MKISNIPANMAYLLRVNTSKGVVKSQQKICNQSQHGLATCQVFSSKELHEIRVREDESPQGGLAAALPTTSFKSHSCG